MTKLYTDEAMLAAMDDVKFNRLSLRKASKKYGVPKSTLNDHLTVKVPEGARWGKQPLFNAREETEIFLSPVLGGPKMESQKYCSPKRS